MTRKGAKDREVATNMVTIGETIERDTPAAQGATMCHRLVKKPCQEIRNQENKSSASMKEKKNTTHELSIKDTSKWMIAKESGLLEKSHLDRLKTIVVKLKSQRIIRCAQSSQKLSKLKLRRIKVN